jgi:hypothetical protein
MYWPFFIRNMAPITETEFHADFKKMLLHDGWFWLSFIANTNVYCCKSIIYCKYKCLLLQIKSNQQYGFHAVENQKCWSS